MLENLEGYLKKADEIIPIEKLVSNKESTRFYYRINQFFYRMFHSREGAFHFPVEWREGETHIEKLKYQANYIASKIESQKAQFVIEFGCGIGYNIRYLAQKFPKVKFIGIDISDSNIQWAKRQSQNLKNLSFFAGDFDTFSKKKYKADIVFGVETFCYAQNLEKLMNTLVSNTARNGSIVIFDAFENQFPKNENEQRAYRWLCWGWSLDRFHSISKMEALIEELELELKEKRNLTQQILPNFHSYHVGTIPYLNYSKWLKILRNLRILPEPILRQMMAGVFGYDLTKDGYLQYILYDIKTAE